jgi:hypothetical protein
VRLSSSDELNEDRSIEGDTAIDTAGNENLQHLDK